MINTTHRPVAGVVIDRMIAEHFMGGVVREYSTSLEKAWELITRLRRDGVGFCIEDSHNNSVDVRLSSWGIGACAYDYDQPIGICVAALRLKRCLPHVIFHVAGVLKNGIQVCSGCGEILWQGDTGFEFGHRVARYIDTGAIFVNQGDANTAFPLNGWDCDKPYIFKGASE